MFDYIAVLYLLMFIDVQNDLSLATGSLFKLAPDFTYWNAIDEKY